jgi:hypothetical protein
VVLINPEITFGLELEIESSVSGKEAEHVIQESHGRTRSALPRALKVQLQGDLGLRGRPGDTGRSLLHGRTPLHLAPDALYYCLGTIGNVPHPVNPALELKVGPPEEVSNTRGQPLCDKKTAALAAVSLLRVLVETMGFSL